MAERYGILADDKDFVYNLGQNDFQSIANRQTFPAMVGTGTSIAAARFPGMPPTITSIKIQICNPV